jgi:hypothetical protein
VARHGIHGNRQQTIIVRMRALLVVVSMVHVAANSIEYNALQRQCQNGLGSYRYNTLFSSAIIEMIWRTGGCQNRNRDSGYHPRVKKPSADQPTNDEHVSQRRCVDVSIDRLLGGSLARRGRSEVREYKYIRKSLPRLILSPLSRRMFAVRRSFPRSSSVERPARTSRTVTRDSLFFGTIKISTRTY